MYEHGDERGGAARTERACDEARERLVDYVDGLLARAESEAVERHLAVCAACRQEAEALDLVPALLGSLPRSRAPEGLLGRVQAGLDAIDRERAAGRRRRAALGAGAALAASLLAALVLTRPWSGGAARPGGGPEPEGSVARDGAPGAGPEHALAAGAAGGRTAEGPGAGARGERGARERAPAEEAEPALASADAGAASAAGAAAGPEAPADAAADTAPDRRMMPAADAGHGARAAPGAALARTGPAARGTPSAAPEGAALAGGTGTGASGGSPAAGGADPATGPSGAARGADSEAGGAHAARAIGDGIPGEARVGIEVERARHEAAFALDSAALHDEAVAALTDAERAALGPLAGGLAAGDAPRAAERGAPGAPAPEAADAGPAVVIEVVAADRAAARAEVERVIALHPTARLRAVGEDEVVVVVTAADLRAVLADLEGSAVIEVTIPPLDLVLGGVRDGDRVLLTLPIAARE